MNIHQLESINMSPESLKDEQRQQAEALLKERALPGPEGKTILPDGIEHVVFSNGDGRGWSDIYRKTSN